MTDDMARKGKYSSERLDERQVYELMGIARGVMADHVLRDAEVEFLQKWLVANDAVKTNPVISLFLSRIQTVLADGIVDEDERLELSDALGALINNEFELGEVLKPSSLPLCNPAPVVNFSGMRFTFTGTFLFGKRKECERAVEVLGATTGGVAARYPGYVVIGEYVTDAWQNSSFGRKIEKAVQLREEGASIAIISENHWREALR